MIATASLLLTLVLPAEGPASPAVPATARLTGGFIQIQGWMVGLSPEDWQRELTALRDAGLDTIIVQYLRYNDSSYLPRDAENPDPVGHILDFADDHGLTVFLGTQADDGWWNWDEAYLERSLHERKALTRQIHERYGAHPSFGGWYFTEECSGGLTPERVALLRDYFRAQSDHCKGLRDLPVALAPYFSQLTPLESMRTIYRDLLDGAGIDILMLQDGVGARGWDEDLEERVVPFFQMFAEVCRERGVTLWSDLESFRLEPGSRRRFVPADIDRVGRQIAAEAPYVATIVTFDFFHYMSPHRGEAQRRLYEAYLSRYPAPRIEVAPDPSP